MESAKNLYDMSIPQLQAEELYAKKYIKEIRRLIRHKNKTRTKLGNIVNHIET